jgi:putative peptide zinc metalloprotease protein
VAPEVGGFLRELYVRDGDRVRAGDILAQLSSPQLETELKVNRREQTLRREQVKALQTQIVKGSALDSKLTESYQAAQFELNALARTQAELERLQAQLTVRAPRDGVIMRLVGKEEVGKALDKGALLCHIGDENALRAALLVPPEDRSLVKEGETAWIRVHGLGVNAWPGSVASISAAEAREIPPQLSSKVGGDIATQSDADTRTEKPQSQHYLVTVRFNQTGDVIQPGVMARVKIETPARSIWWRVNRYLSREFNWGL